LWGGLRRAASENGDRQAKGSEEDQNADQAAQLEAREQSVGGNQATGEAAMGHGLRVLAPKNKDRLDRSRRFPRDQKRGPIEAPDPPRKTHGY